MDAADELTVTMTAAEWNQTMAILGEGPYRLVAPLLAKIQQQAMAQDKSAAPPVALNGPAAPREPADVPH